jgi:hypothetical protein
MWNAATKFLVLADVLVLYTKFNLFANCGSEKERWLQGLRRHNVVTLRNGKLWSEQKFYFELPSGYSYKV